MPVCLPTQNSEQKQTSKKLKKTAKNKIKKDFSIFQNFHYELVALRKYPRTSFNFFNKNP